MLRLISARRAFQSVNTISRTAHASSFSVLSTNIDIMADKPSSSSSSRGFRKRPSTHSHRRPTPAKRAATVSNTMSSSTASAASINKIEVDPPASKPPMEMFFTHLSEFNLHPKILDSVTKVKGFSTMSEVQAATVPLTLCGHDILAQAKTGTGKTLAFLLPAIQKLITTRPITRNSSGSIRAPRRPSAFIISPTRELALQIAAEAEELLKGLSYPSDDPCPYTVQTAIGGTNSQTGLKNLKRGCDIIVATPGRILDYMQDKDALRILSGVQTLVLDEADRLLDMGFVKDIRKIVQMLPDRTTTERQSMLFSATVDKNVQVVADFILSPDHKFVNTIPRGAPQTHERVSQRLMVVDRFADVAPATLDIISRDLKAFGSQSFKAIVFVPTTVHTTLFAGFLEALAVPYKLPKIMSISGRQSQSKRTNTAKQFREGENGILVATDVIARGLDFPHVTHVYQAGLPDDKASYIHRLGRTARAGADGNGALILTRDETTFAEDHLREVLFKDTAVELTCESPKMREAMKSIETETREKAYRAIMGYYLSQLKMLGYAAGELVKKMNEFALEGLSLDKIPSFEPKTVAKMRLKGIPGVVIQATK